MSHERREKDVGSADEYIKISAQPISFAQLSKLKSQLCSNKKKKLSFESFFFISY